jgi:hypothetical protein
LSILNLSDKPFKTDPSRCIAKPLVIKQVSIEPILIIDPYKAALEKNFYFPLCQGEMSEETENLASQENRNDPVTQESLPRLSMDDVERSLDTITDMLHEAEDDDLPVQTQSEPVEQFSSATEASTPSYFKHRFSIYRKGSTPYIISP